MTHDVIISIISLTILHSIAFASPLNENTIDLNYQLQETVPSNVEICNIIHEVENRVKHNQYMSNHSWILAPDVNTKSFIFKVIAEDQNISNLFHVLQNGSLMTSTSLDRDIICTSTGKKQTNFDEARRRINPPMTNHWPNSANSEQSWRLGNKFNEKQSADDLVYICRITFKVFLFKIESALTQDKPIEIVLTIDLFDINDNAPKWMPDGKMMTGNSYLNNEIKIYFKDGDPIGQSQLLPNCIDADAGRNSRLSFTLRDLNNSTRLQLSPLEVDDFQLQVELESGLLFLTTKNELDRERIPSYNLVVMAADDGELSLSSELYINVVLFDVNDNTPIFNQTILNQNYEIDETTEIGTKVLQLEAHDPDEGINGEIVFSFSESQSIHYETVKLARKLFQISRNGLVTVRSRLDVDDPNLAFVKTHVGANGKLQKLLNFKIQAKDSAHHPYERMSEANVEIWINDVNDESPVIKTQILTHTKLLTVMENEDPGTQVTLFEVRDADITRDEKVACQVDNVNFTVSSVDTADQNVFSNEIFSKEPKSYSKSFSLNTKVSLDRDHSPGAMLIIILQCFDKVGHETREKLSVQILDKNDNKPEFVMKRLKMLLEENAPINTSLNVYRNFDDPIYPNNQFAYDIDAGKNAEIRYEIYKPNGRSNYEIDPVLGVIKSQTIFDYEQTKNDTFILLAYDLGEPSFTANTTVEVEIIDMNDNSPKFSMDLYTFNLTENEPSNTFVGQVEATDVDSSYFGQFRYYLGEKIGSHGVIPFHIDTVTGRITSQRSLDREKESQYMFTVIAKDAIGYKPYIRNKNIGKFDQKTSTTTVHVIIKDVNDNAPSVKAFSLQSGQPIGQHSTVEVGTDEPRGSQILQFTVNDADEHTNSESRLTIKVGNDYGLFSLDSNSGLLILEKDIREYIKLNPNNRKMLLSIEACDNGTVQLCARPLDITINFVDLITKPYDPYSTLLGNDQGLFKGNEKTMIQKDYNNAPFKSNDILIGFIIIFTILTISAFIAFFIVWQRFQKSSDGRSLFGHLTNNVNTNGLNPQPLAGNYIHGQYTLAKSHAPNDYGKSAFYHLRPLNTINPANKHQSIIIDPKFYNDHSTRPKSQESPFNDEINGNNTYHQLIAADNGREVYQIHNATKLNNSGNYDLLNNENYRFNQTMTRSRSQQIDKKIMPNRFDSTSTLLMQKNATRSFDELTFSSIEEEHPDMKKNKSSQLNHQIGIFPETSFV